MKRVLSIILATLMCLSCFSFGAGALSVETGNNAVFELGSVEAFPGDTISIPVVVSLGAEANSVGLIFAEDNGGTLEPLYDKDVFTFVEFDQKNAPGAFFKAYDNSKQSINLGWNGDVGDADSTSMKDTQICVAKFKIADDAPIDEYTIDADTVVKLSIEGRDEIIFECSVIPATVTVKGQDFPSDIKFTGATFPYDGDSHNIEVALGSAAGISGVEVNYTCDGDDFTGAVDAGTYDITATITAPGYNKVVKEATLKITPKDVTVSGEIANKEYDGTTDATWAVVPVLTGAVTGDDVDITYDAVPQFAKKDASTTAIKVTNGIALVGTDKGNYNLKTDVNTTAKINQRQLKVELEDKVVRVGGTLPELTYKITSGELVEGDTITGKPATTATNTKTAKNYPITKGTLSAGTNYKISFDDGTLSVIAKEIQVVDIEAVEDKTYGDEAFNLVVSEGAGTQNAVEFESLTPGVVSVDEDGKVTIVGAGTAKIKVTKAGDADNADFAETVTFTVAKKNLIVTAEDRTVMVGEGVPVFTYKVEGLVNGDVKEDVFTGSLTTTIGTSKPGSASINKPTTFKISSSYTSKYVLQTYNKGTFSVIDKTIQNVVVTPNVPASITYGDEGFKIDAVVGEPATDSTVTFTSDNEAVATVDAAGNVEIIGAGKANITVAKTGSDLYADFKQVIPVVVNKVEITVNAQDKGKRIYGEDPELTYTYTGELVGEDNFTGALTREEGEAVGEYDILQGTLALSDNYNIKYNKATFTIYDKIPQTITVAPVEAKTYGDADFTLEVNLGETYNTEKETTFASSDTYVATVDGEGYVTIIGAGSVKITVAREGNADLADFSKVINITIAKRPITVTAEAKEKYVGQDTPELTYTYTPELIGFDSFSGELSVNDGNVAGRKYDIKQGDLSLGNNYKISYVGAKLSVLAKKNQDVTFDAPTSATFGQKGHKYTAIKGEASNEAAEFVVTSSNTDVAVIGEDNAISIVGAGKTTIKATLEGNYMYNNWSDSVILTVAKRKITLAADDKVKKIDNQDPPLTYTLSDTETASLSGDIFINFGPLSGEVVKNVVLEREAGEELGEYDIVIKSYEFTENDAHNYSVTLKKGTFTIIDKFPQTITGVEGTYEKTFGDEAFMLTPVSAELPATTFTYASDNEAVATVSENGEVTVIGAGQANITVTAMGDEDFAATPVKTVVTVAPKTILASDITINLENKTAVITGTEGLSVDFAKLVITLGEYDDVTANVTLSNVVLTGEGAANYAVEAGAQVAATVPVAMLATVTVVIPEEMADKGTVAGDGVYLKGTEVTLTATPAKNYKVSQWAAGEEKLGTAKTYTFTIEDSIEITLTFKKVTTGGGGGGGGVVTTPDKTDKEEEKPEEKPEDTETPENPEDNKDDETNKDDTDVKVEWKGDDHYGDIKTNDWYFEAIKEVTELGLMNGVTEEEFAPETNLTRAMLVTILYRFDGEDEVAADETHFTDAEVDEYYGDALIWATQNGIIKGLTETEFGPDELVTREQKATILFRYASFKGMDAVNMAENLEGFSDADDISEYALGAFNWAVGAGLFEGREDGTLAPLDNLTRAEAATLIVRFSKLGIFAE